MKYFLVLFLMLPIFKVETARAQQAVKISGVNFASAFKGESIGQTSPSISFTVPAGQICEVTFTCNGQLNSVGDLPAMRVLEAGSYLAMVSTILININTPYRNTCETVKMMMNSGSYTFNTLNPFAPNLGNAAVSGFCWKK